MYADIQSQSGVESIQENNVFLKFKMRLIYEGIQLLFQVYTIFLRLD